MKNFTWDDLAEAISKLSPKQRKNKVFMSIDDESIFRHVEGVETVLQDVYVNKDNDEDCGSLEDLKDAWGDDFNKSDYRLSTKKGTPFLWDGF